MMRALERSTVAMETTTVVGFAGAIFGREIRFLEICVHESCREEWGLRQVLKKVTPAATVQKDGGFFSRTNVDKLSVRCICELMLHNPSYASMNMKMGIREEEDDGMYSYIQATSQCLCINAYAFDLYMHMGMCRGAYALIVPIYCTYKGTG